MARAKPGFLADDLRGRVGNVVFSQTRYGQVVRAYTHPHNPQTPSQQAGRGRFAASVAAWRDLSAAQKELWKAWAGTQIVTDIDAGTARRPTAYAAFVSFATRWQAGHPGEPIPDTPPSPAPPSSGTPPPSERERGQ